MTFGVLFPPEDKQQRRHSRQHRLRAVHPRMARWAKRDHQLQLRAARNTMVNDHAALPCSGRIAHPAAIPVPFQHCFPETAEMFLVLPAEGVAGGTHAMREHGLSTAAAVHRELDGLSLALHR